MAAIHGRYRSGSHFFYASEYACLSRTHSKSYFLCLSLADWSQRSPSLAPLYLYRALRVSCNLPIRTACKVRRKVILCRLKPTTAQRCRSETEKNILENLQTFSKEVQYCQNSKDITPPGNLKFNYLDIFQSFKLRFSMEKMLLISLKLHFTLNTLGCYGLIFFFLILRLYKKGVSRSHAPLCDSCNNQALTHARRKM